LGRFVGKEEKKFSFFKSQALKINFAFIVVFGEVYKEN
jgi:hypothetical protein